MNFLRLYLHYRKKEVFLFFLFSLIFFLSFFLYHLPWQAVLYPVLLCMILGGIFFFLDLKKAKKKHQKLLQYQQRNASSMEEFFSPITLDDWDYQQIIDSLCREQWELENQLNTRYRDMIDYYTTWAHQIKTPIASMRLTLQSEDSGFSRKLSSDLFRIEQYVEMVLMFLRLGSSSTDYVIREFSLDDLVRDAVKKYAGEFIQRKIRLNYEPLQTTVISDEKWLSFVVEQVLSNALKYTRSGSVTIFLEEPKILCIQDTGIGITPKDLPRIFEKGYTGYNGRGDKRASGIGLYLCKRICTNLGHQITAASSLNEGTTIRIDLAQQRLNVE